MFKKQLNELPNKKWDRENVQYISIEFTHVSI